MLLVKTYIGPSKIHGIGLFAAENIRKGTVVWEFNQNTTQIFWKKQFLSICNGMSLPAILEFIDHSYIKDGNIYYLNDRTKFINHSTTPNIAFKTSKTEFAIRDINAGDEITENYYLSYDKNDFFCWDSICNYTSKVDLLRYMKSELLVKSKPVRNFEL